MNTHPNEFTNLPERLSGLGELAENMWWSWNPSARMLFKMLDRPAWKESRYNPDKMLKELPPEILKKAAGNPDYLRQYDVVMSQFKNHLARKGCPLLSDYQIPENSVIAYFSAEYGLHLNEGHAAFALLEQIRDRVSEGMSHPEDLGS
jgi:starch phosphorylase